jgi:hypothetical protein
MRGNRLDRKRSGGRVFFDDYSMPDPLDDDLLLGMYAARYGTLTKRQTMKLLACAEAYFHFVAHPAPTAMIVKQLREVRKEFV